MLEPYDGKLSRTVLRGEGGCIPLTYPVGTFIDSMRLRLSLLIVFNILSSVLDSSATGQDSIQSSEFNFKSNIKLEAFRGGFQY